MPRLLAYLAISTASPSWFSPSVMTIIALFMSSAGEKELMAMFMAVPMAVPWVGTISVDISSRYILADTKSVVIGNWV